MRVALVMTSSVMVQATDTARTISEALTETHSADKTLQRSGPGRGAIP